MLAATVSKTIERIDKTQMESFTTAATTHDHPPPAEEFSVEFEAPDAGTPAALALQGIQNYINFCFINFFIVPSKCGIEGFKNI